MTDTKIKRFIRRFPVHRLRLGDIVHFVRVVWRLRHEGLLFAISISWSALWQFPEDSR
jgi:hypothetical protein